jgi:glyoxylase-like metal-dependent hydrolase (beta-lactamase superfamily II)
MTIRYELLLHGNNLSFHGGFFGFCNVVLVWVDENTPLLFDTGHYCVRKGLLKGLADRGLSPAKIPHIFLSHLHFDHCHNLDLFPNAKVWVSQTELDYAAQPAADDTNVPWKIHELLKDMDVRIIDGDGVVLPGIEHFAVPGHTPGSQALRFRNTEGKLVVLAGDAVKYPKEIIAEGSDLVFDTKANASASIRKISQQADVIVPGHFSSLFKRDGRWLWDEPGSLEILIR